MEAVLKEEKSKRLTEVPKPQKKNPVNWQRFLPKYNELIEKARRRFSHSPAKSSAWTKFKEGEFTGSPCCPFLAGRNGLTTVVMYVVVTKPGYKSCDSCRKRQLDGY